MDVNSLISNMKQKKHHDGEGTNESSIKICDLPDPILQLIISSLSTKDAVRTSVLSKRWVYLWRGISKIQLKEEAPEKRQQFIDFVRRSLEVCDCSNLKKFLLSCKVGEDAPEINEWLHGFINPKIQELNLDLEGMEEPLVFPVHLFTCATLTNFRLCMNHIFKIPSFIHFESLRTLTLKDIIFPDSFSTQHLFSGCPSLEELTLYCCSWVNVKAVCISSPVLQKLFIIEGEDDYDKSDGLNVPNCCNVAIVGTNLKSFSYSGNVKNDYLLFSSTSVIDATVEVEAPPDWWSVVDWDRDACYFVFKLLKELPNVEKLSISQFALSAMGSTPSLLGHLPLFCNLAELCVVDPDSPIELSCEALLTVLRKSPNLQVVEFEGGGGVSLPSDSANNSILDTLPMCFRENLKRINISDAFSGPHDEEELHAIKILLQEASVLETLHITCFELYFDYPTGSKRVKKFYEQIVRFPKRSADCEIVLEYR